MKENAKRWDKHACAAAWGVTFGYVQRIIQDVPGALLETINGKATWTVPAGSKNPKQKKGKKNK